jgi:hypothetical protein
LCIYSLIILPYHFSVPFLTIAERRGIKPPEIKLKVLSSETVPLQAITAEEAEREGFAVPDFCVSQFICGNIETRLDFEDYAFRYENGVKIPRPKTEREQLLREKVERLCPSCVIRKNAKDLFLRYWKPKVPDGDHGKI